LILEHGKFKFEAFDRLLMHIFAQLPQDFWVIVVIIFGGVFMFVLVSYADAQASGGWNSFVKRYSAKTRPLGNAYSVSSWTYCNVHCWNPRGLRVIFTDTGIYFYKTFPSRLAHPPFLLPWKSVRCVNKGNGFFGEYYIVEVKDAAGTFSLDLHRRVENDLSRYYKAPITYSPEPK
jgi:hypothetical protein